MPVGVDPGSLSPPVRLSAWDRTKGIGVADSKGRAGRLRTIAIGLLLVGAALAFLVGAAFPAQVGAGSFVPGAPKVTTYTASPDGGNSSFNWLFAILVAGPAVVASSVLYGCAEIVGGLRRSSRTRSSESGSGGHDGGGAS